MVADKRTSKPVLLIIESDPRVREALAAAIQDDFVGHVYSTIDDAFVADQTGILPRTPDVAIIELKEATKDELARCSSFFQDLPPMPIFVTVRYDSDFQLQETYIKAWGKNVIFRPFNVEQLIKSLRGLINKTS